MSKERIKDILSQKAQNKGLDLTEEMTEKFFIYMENLKDWNKKINLTAIKEDEDIVIKHFLDSIIITKEIEGGKLIDIGSGAGFPGIPLKIVRDDLNVTLVDSVNKKVNFMSDTIEKLQLNNISAIHGRAEDLAHNEEYREKFDIAVSRAVANMSTLVEYMLPFVKVGGKCLCLKGPNSNDEIEKAKNAIKILGGKIERVDNYNIESNERSLVIILKEKCTEQTYPRLQGKPLKSPL